MNTKSIKDYPLFANKKCEEIKIPFSLENVITGISIDKVIYDKRARNILQKLSINNLLILINTKPDTIYKSECCGIRTIKIIQECAYKFILNLVPNLETSYDEMERSNPLSCTLLDFLYLNENERTLIEDTLDITKVEDILPCFEEKEFEQTLFIGIDSAINIAYLSVGVLTNNIKNQEIFSQIASSLKKIAETTIKRKLKFNVINSLSTEKVFKVSSLKILNREILSTHSIPKYLITFLKEYDLKWTSLKEMSEKDLYDRFGFSFIFFKILLILQDLKPYIDDFNKRMVNALLNDYYNSYEFFVEEFSRKAFKSPTKREIFNLYCTYTQKPKLTLEKVAQKIGITRERVRQILYKFDAEFYEMRFSEELKTIIEPLLCIYYAELENYGGVITIEHIKNILMMTFPWKTEPSSFFLRIILKMQNDKLHLIDNKSLDANALILSINDVHCVRCQLLKNNLTESIQKKLKIALNEVDSILKEACNKECLYFKYAKFYNYKYYLQYLILSNHISENQSKIKGNNAYSYCYWVLSHGKLSEAVELILKIKKKKMHFNEVYKELGNYRSLEHKSPTNIHAILTKSKNCLLWDRGTFIHANQAKLPYDIIRKIEDWIAIELEQKAFITVEGPFKRFYKSLNNYEIASETALYTLLGISDDPRFSYYKLPYIVLKNSKIPSITSIIEEYIKSFGAIVHNKAVFQYFEKQYYLKQYSIDQYLQHSPNVIKTGHGFIHIDLIHFNKDVINDICFNISKELKISKHISIEKIFNEKPVTCKTNGIISAQMLYHFLENFYDDIFAFPKYPKITLLSEDTKALHPKEEIIEYVKNKGTVCHFIELEKEFVKKRGYFERTVRSISFKSEILNYCSETWIHRNNLSLDSKSLKIIKDLTIEECSQGQCNSIFWGSISNILEFKQLPKIHQEINWTKDLLINILNEMNDFLILGSNDEVVLQKNNIIKIHTFEDFLAVFLKYHFGNSCSIEDFNKTLFKYNIIRRDLTVAYLSKLFKIKTDGYIVSLKN